MSLSGNTRPWEHDANPNLPFLASGLLRSLAENTRIHSNCARQMVKNRWRQPFGSVVGHLGLQCSLLGTLVLGSLGLWCPLAGTPGLGSLMRVQTRGFSPRVLLTCWRKLVRSCCSRKRVQHRWCRPVGSLVGRLGLQCPPLGTSVLSIFGLLCPPQQHQASGARRESEPTGSRVVASSLFGKKMQEITPTAPEGTGALSCFCLTRARLFSKLTGIASS